MTKVTRQTVDLSAFPDLVVIYLGIEVNAWIGLKRLFGLGPQIKNSVNQRPDGLLLHENFLFSLIPLHLGMRQYWRNFDNLRRGPVRHPIVSGGETSFGRPAGPALARGLLMRGGMEAVYDDTLGRVGFGQFAPSSPPVDQCVRPESRPVGARSGGPDRPRGGILRRGQRAIAL